MAVTLYRQVGKGKDRRYQKVNLGRGRRPADLTGPYFLRYLLADGTPPWEHVGDDLDEAIAARERKQAYFEALDANVPVVQDQDDLGRTKITDAVYQSTSDIPAPLGSTPTVKLFSGSKGYLGAWSANYVEKTALISATSIMSPASSCFWLPSITTVSFTLIFTLFPEAMMT